MNLLHVCCADRYESRLPATMGRAFARRTACGFLPATAGENIVLSARLCIVLWIWDLFLGKLFGHLDMAAVAPREIILLLLSLSTFNKF